MKKNFLEKLYTKYSGEIILRPFPKKTTSVHLWINSMDQSVSHSLFFVAYQVEDLKVTCRSSAFTSYIGCKKTKRGL